MMGHVDSEPRDGFGALLRQFRVIAGLSQEALAQRARLSVDAVAALERGRRTRPRAFTLGLLADALALDAADRARLVSAASGRGDASAEGGPPDPGTPLPVRLTSLVGREHELAEVARLLGQCRLLTLLGPGGTGKTTLALAVAQHHPGTCWFAALDACPEPGLVTRVVATAVGVREVTGTALVDTLRQYLATANGLLVLDNSEHVAAAVAELSADLLGAAPRLRILATSREVLRVPGEVTWQVPPLPEADAVALFADRAALAVPGFTLDVANAAPVARVCQRLDGIPLAIELAAARSRTLTPAQLAVQLDDAFTLLTSGPRTAAPRHQTLRAAVDWSYRLLSPDEQRLFARISVFVGGFDLAAADAVWAAPAVDLLAALVDRSLVLAEPAGDAMRYRVLEVLRQYGQARLAESGEENETRRRHAEYHLRLAQSVPRGWPTVDQRRWLTRLRAERANLDAALHWAATRAPDIAAELTYALAPFWTADGSINEGRTRLEAALPAARGVLKIRILDASAGFAYLQGNYGAAVARGQQSVDARRAAGDERGLARRLNLLGIHAVANGEVTAGQLLLHEALQTLTAQNDPLGAAESNTFLGLAALACGDLASAERHALSALAVQRDADDPYRLSASQGLLCLVMIEKGDLAEARVRGAECLKTVVGPLRGARWESGWLWIAMLLAEAESRDRAAIRLLGAIEVWERRGARLLEALRRRYQPVADQLRQRTNPATVATLMAEGATMHPAELAAQALATSDDVPE
jgi:predicted ATPase/transcriptional regulator with XRE-family HTH domain